MGFGGGFKSGGELPGQILAYTHVTGARDGSGDVVLIGGRTAGGSGAGFRATDKWFVSHEVGHTDSQLTTTFVMPASGRAMITFEGNLWWHGNKSAINLGDTEGAWEASDAQLQAALTASSQTSATWAQRESESFFFFSLSTSNTSYVPAGPRDEFERMVMLDNETDENAIYHSTHPGSWVMTGAAGGSHTVSLAFSYQNMNGGSWATGRGAYSNYVGFLMYGGSGITNTDEPIFGPVGLKAVSLPSA